MLAHSLRLASGKLKKGKTLSAEDVAALGAEGVETVTAARLEPGDVGEDAAAAALAAALAPDAAARGISVAQPFTGRVNLYATRPGLFEIAPSLVHAVNAVDEAVTLATLPPESWVAPRRMLATAKIIPYAAPEAALARAVEIASAAGDGLPRVRPLAVSRVRVLLTKTRGMSEKLLAGGADAVNARLAALGLPTPEAEIVAHDADALAAALRSGEADLTLILAASATSDRRDVAPAAIVAAGGRIERLGMPVDPGNLLVLGDVAGAPVVGLPGCARSPALNGADWVLERRVAGRTVRSAEIAGMGGGGLLKEIPSRPSPRAARRAAAARPKISAVLLAAGGSTRFAESDPAGGHKLLEAVDGAPLVRRSAAALAQALGGALDELVIVLGARAEEMTAALQGLDARLEPAAAGRDGMAASLRAGLGAIAADADAVLVALADMPEVDAALVGRLAAAFDAEEGREIVRPAVRGRPGHPVLFGRRFFEALTHLSGDEGARRIIAEHPDRLVEIAVENDAPLLDLDDRRAFDAYLASRD